MKTLLCRGLTAFFATVGMAALLPGAISVVFAQNPGGYSASPSSFRERPSENPVRFVFAPKPPDGSPQAENPSAAAIWSTFLSGEMSPEIVEWHVRKRRETQAEAKRAALQNRRLPSSYSTVSRQKPEKKDADHSKRRLEFSLAELDRGNSTALVNPLESPSAGAIWVRLLTGRQNREMADWKDERANYLASLDRPRNFSPVPIPITPMIQDPWENQGPEAISELLASLTPEAAPPIPETIVEEMDFAPAPRSLRETESNFPAREVAVMKNLPSGHPLSERFVDDSFPTSPPKISATSYSHVSTREREVDNVRQVSDLSADSSQRFPKLLPEDAVVYEPGQIKVYRTKESSADDPSVSDESSVARPLPPKRTSKSNDGWSPVE